MENQQLIRNFLELLDQSGLPDARKAYWLERLGRDKADPEDEQRFADELIAHQKTLDDAIELTEAQIAADQAKAASLDAEALPYLRQLEALQPAYYENAAAGYKKDVLAAEKQMMGDLEGVRGETQSAEIDAIRKKLMG